MGKTGRNVRYLTADEIISRNKEILLKTGGYSNSAGIVANRNSLEYLIAVVQDNEIYTALNEKAALYAFNIITRHVFVDGCKRTGMACAFLFIEFNGHSISRSITSDNIVEIALGVANNSVSDEKLSKWFKNQVIK